jgi:ribosomal protein S18 acetylase RimI-like enzyme
MISLSQPRRIAAGDYYQISNLICYDANSHRHLDWRSPLEWIGDPNYWALEEFGKLNAILACPADPPQVAWIRVFAHQPHLSAPELWKVIWETARGEIAPQTAVASIATRPWFQRILLASGFEQQTNVVLLDLLLDYPRYFKQRQDFAIRPMRDEDLPAVANIDYEAFGWFWHNTADALNRARAVALYTTVAEDDAGIIGYQISTGNAANVHLARLAVKPQAQGRGVGGALVDELIWHTGARHYSVNTQQDNLASLTLYKKAGFFRTGESLPVLVYQT